MKRRVENRFFFFANAVALAARIRRAENAFVPAVASACLPVTGGVGSGESEGGQYGDVLSFGRAMTKVSGDFVRPDRAVAFTSGNHGENLLPTESSAEASLRELRIINGDRRLEIDGLEAGLGSYSDRRRGTEFRKLTANFQNVRIDGVPLLIKTHGELFTEHATYQKLAQTYARSLEFRERYSEYFESERPVNRKHRAIPESQGLIYTTVVSAIEWQGKPPEGTSIHRNGVRVHGFGTIYFGELIIEHDFRRLTLLRFELGSPTGGDGSAAEVQTNGSSWPPQ